MQNPCWAKLGLKQEGAAPLASFLSLKLTGRALYKNKADSLKVACLRLTDRLTDFLIFLNFWENPLKIGLSDFKNDFSDRNNVIEDLTNGQNG